MLGVRWRAWLQARSKTARLWSIAPTGGEGKPQILLASKRFFEYSLAICLCLNECSGSLKIACHFQYMVNLQVNPVQ